MRPPRILIAEDHSAAAQNLGELLQADLEVDVDVVTNGKDALAALHNRHYSILLTDLKMPGLGGQELIQQIEKEEIPVTVIVMTGHGSIEKAVEAMRHGVDDFLTKPLDPDHVQFVVKRALRERALQDEVAFLREKVRHGEAFAHVITKSQKMLSILELVANIAHTNTTVLIQGGTGTGKEMIARAIHQASACHRPGPMVAVNCAALPENLLESELFGHEKGAFTGAVSQRKGKFEQAGGGTVFLDEIGEIPPAMQVKLLRALQERQIERLGGSAPINVDVRIIAATNGSLTKMVKKGTFREDLYYRVNVVKIDLPPLRERPEDIPLLARHFCEKYALPHADALDISPTAMQVLLNHHWPGNVRELENVIERACVICQTGTIGPEHLPPDLSQRQQPRSPYKVDLRTPLPDQLRELTADFESRYIRKALRKTRGNVRQCADLCGVSRRTITNKIAEYQIEKDQCKES